MDILPAFHKQQTHATMPIKMKNWTSYLGRTSTCTDIAFSNGLTGVPIATAVSHDVCVDFTTRRPCKLSTQWVEDISNGQLTRKAPPRGFTQPMTPNDCFVYTTKVVSSGTDSNQHQNMALHIRDCWNAGSAAACEGKLSHFDKDLVYYRVKSATFLYLGEVLIGDELNIACWEHNQDYDTLCFTMTKRSKVVGQCQMIFFPKELGLRTVKAKL